VNAELLGCSGHPSPLEILLLSSWDPRILNCN
jgi:hypothetical protein